MMGQLIVEDETPLDVDRDITVLMADWQIGRCRKMVV